MRIHQTELEKRWAAEDVEEQIKSGAVSEEFLASVGNFKDEVVEDVEEQMEESESLDGVDVEDAELYLNTPLIDEKQFPLVMITYNSRTIIGGLVDVGEEGVWIHCPMHYFEMPHSQDPGQINAGLQKIHQLISVPEQMWFKQDSLIMLYANNPTHMNLAGLYEQAYNKVRLMEMGLASPTVDQVQKINN